ncbi:MAG: tripartite tricarboxylate transporter substrate binding protein [Hyphomicrobiales bacterium]|nr:tripartite tricarboxylate transporter substrate binding protein [Hyphomicrobiales bacterium]
MLVVAHLIMALALAASTAAVAQPYPAKPIKLVVGFPAGGATDTTARLIAQRMQASLGQTIVVENIGGAGGSIAAKQVAVAPADGYTLMMTTTSAFGTQPRLYKLDYDPLKAFVPVATLVVDKSVLVVGPAWPVTTVQAMVAEARANPGKFNYGSAIGIGPHFVFELFKRKAAVDIVHVPYRGGGPMIADLIGGQIHATVNGKSVLRQHIQTGKVRALGVSAAQRWDDMKAVPTLIEAGFLDAPYDTLFGIVAPAGVPAPIVERLNAVINEALGSAEMRASLDKLGIEPFVTTPQAFARLVAEEAPRWSQAVALTGIKVQ